MLDMRAPLAIRTASRFTIRVLLACCGVAAACQSASSRPNVAGIPSAVSGVAGASAAPLGRVRATLPDSTFWPEGMDYDPRNGRYYVASVRHRTIAEVMPTGVTRELWPRGRRDLGAMLGVRVDTARGVLWATTSGIPQTAGYVPGDSAIAALLRIRIADGTIEKRWDLAPSPSGHTLGDLAVGPAGDVYVTDSNEPVLYRLRPGADTLEHFTDSLFKNLQGLAPTPDGRTLYLADYRRGLLRVDLATNEVRVVGDSAGRTFRGVDGIALIDGTIIGVRNGVSPAQVIRVVLDPTGTHIAGGEAIDSDSVVADEPTIGAIVGDDFVYVANSQWEKHDRAGVLLPTAVLKRPVLLAVRARR